MNRIIWSFVKRKGAFEHAQNVRSRSILRMRVSSGLCTPLIHSNVSNNSVSDTEGRDQTADAQADLDPRCSHLAEDMFLPW